jgi:hypothetical protein
MAIACNLVDWDIEDVSRFQTATRCYSSILLITPPRFRNKILYHVFDHFHPHGSSLVAVPDPNGKIHNGGCGSDLSFRVRCLLVLFQRFQTTRYVFRNCDVSITYSFSWIFRRQYTDPLFLDIVRYFWYSLLVRLICIL